MEKNILRKLRSIVSKENLLCENIDLHCYSYDASNAKSLPDAIVFPTSIEQISKIVKIANKYKIPFIPRGAGTNLSGGSIALKGGIIISLTKMNNILEINTDERYVIVEPGVVNLDLQNILLPLGFFFAPDPGSQKVSTIGGNVGENAGGPRSLKYGVTTNHTLGVEVVLPDGEIIQTDINSTGYDLTGFFVGSEGTLGIITKIKLKILPLPDDIKTLLISFNTLGSALITVNEIISSGIIPTTLEVMEKNIISAVQKFIDAGYPKDAEAVILVEVDGKIEDTEKETNAIISIAEKNGGVVKIAKNDEERNKLWEGRRGVHPAMAKIAPNLLVEDGVVPRTKLPEILVFLNEIEKKYGVIICNVFHAGDGNIHPQIGFDKRNKDEFERVKKAGREILEKCIELGGSISGEHGIGIDKLDMMSELFDEETLKIFRKLKNAFDPNNLCNPGKIFPEKSSLRTIQKDKIKYDKVIDYDIENFTITVGGNMRFHNLQKILRDKNQMPPLAIKDDITVEELVLNGFSGVRNILLGMRILTNSGRVIKFGGKVMKNVAGYDIGKLFIGSYNSLGEILEITFRTVPFNSEGLILSIPKKKEINGSVMKKIQKVFNE